MTGKTMKKNALNEEDTYGVLVSPGTIQFKRLLPGPIERVWDYLTNPEKTKLWMGGGTFDLRVGGLCEWHCDYAFNLEPEIRKKHNGVIPVIYGRILELEPPRLFKMTWDYSDCVNTSQDGSKSEITFELFPQEQNVLLVLTHSGMPNNHDIRAALAGWHVHIDILSDTLSNVPSAPFMSAHEALEIEYKKRIKGD
ncbi:MAG: SRPBCC family protein [Alphaproteobacteria bacterium]|nr:SRPBCC family protein [Alphaproteobacteria bacterium]